MAVSRATITLFALIIATALSSLAAWQGDYKASLAIGAITIVVAALKMWLIAYEFMEVRTAPLILRVFISGWVVIVTISLLAIHSFSI